MACFYKTLTGSQLLYAKHLTMMVIQNLTLTTNRYIQTHYFTGKEQIWAGVLKRKIPVQITHRDLK
ncbi:hypothetical protein A4D02_01410 [Niastella koreensis]|uniref:Uncharacterized protein n=1 Tax=Niastella koreensis TaxID=354356 RepID=A0ABX3P4U0_9BACT|nr:hypothetical protein A4D02_01410 [Niastella koreensis]